MFTRRTSVEPSPTGSTKARLLPVLILLSGAVACQHRGPAFDPLAEQPGFTTVARDLRPPESLLRPSPEPYRIGPGDVLSIEIAGLPETRATTFVAPDGMVYFDLAGGVKAEGMTLPELSARLETLLANDYRAPRVSITLSEAKSKRFWVLGNVNAPGIYPLARPTTLIDAISTAGGILTSRATGTTIEMADLQRSFIIRDGKPLPVDFQALVGQGNLAHNIQLRPGDFIYLPSITSQEVYVLGAVAKPRAVGLSGTMGLIGAVADAGGILPNAHDTSVLLIRGSLTTPMVAEINLRDIMTGKRRDVPLSPGDVLWIPDSPWTRLPVYLDGVFGTMARTIAANEGRRAVEGAGAQAVGTSINVGQ